jgi:hypothetical protein
MLPEQTRLFQVLSGGPANLWNFTLSGLGRQVAVCACLTRRCVALRQGLRLHGVSICGPVACVIFR